MRHPLACLTLLCSLAASPALAQDAATDEAPFEPSLVVGARVGGYGFRDVGGDGRDQWRDCRMDGLGLFLERSLTEHLFVETAIDVYYASPDDDSHMDRVSGIASAAAGARVFPRSIVSPYVQLGAGLELTRVQLDGHPAERHAFPMFFVGLGAELRLGSHVRAGFNVRMNAMGHFDHTHDAARAHAGDGAHPELEREMEVAGQGQLFLAYRL